MDTKHQTTDEKPTKKRQAFTREGVVEIVTRAAEGDKPEKKSVRLSVSSEEPYLKWVWDEEANDAMDETVRKINGKKKQNK